jgi:hypothetical protein
MFKLLEEISEPFIKMLAKEILLVFASTAAVGIANTGVEYISKKIMKSDEGENSEALDMGLEEIDEETQAVLDKFEEWHRVGDYSIPVHDYLGMTKEEFHDWFFGEEVDE